MVLQVKEDFVIKVVAIAGLSWTVAHGTVASFGKERLEDIGLVTSKNKAFVEYTNHTFNVFLV